MQPKLAFRVAPQGELQPASPNSAHLPSSSTSWSFPSASLRSASPRAATQCTGRPLLWACWPYLLPTAGGSGAEATLQADHPPHPQTFFGFLSHLVSSNRKVSARKKKEKKRKEKKREEKRRKEKRRKEKRETVCIVNCRDAKNFCASARPAFGGLQASHFAETLNTERGTLRESKGLWPPPSP